MALLLMLITTTASADIYSAAIELTGDKNYKSVRLTPEIYNIANADLSNITLVSGETVVPYFINSYRPTSNSEEQSFELSLVNTYSENGYTFYYFSPKEPTENIRATSLQLIPSETAFAKQIEIFGSLDGENWGKIMDDSIYMVSGDRKLLINFGLVLEYPHYYIQMSQGSQDINFRQAFLHYNGNQALKDSFSTSVTPAFEARQKGKNTILSITGLKNLTLDSVTISTDSLFKRRVSFGPIAKTLYNLKFENAEYRDLTMQMYEYKSSENMAELSIVNNDDAPIHITRVQARITAQDLVFSAEGLSEISLSVDTEYSGAAPKYDIEGYRSYILDEGFDAVRMQPLALVGSSQTAPKKQTDPDLMKRILNVIVILTALVLLFVIISRLCTKKEN